MFIEMQPIRPPAAPDSGIHLFVASGGNDSWSGRLAAPNKARNDGPLASIEKAKAVAEQAAHVGAAVKISIASGTYFLSAPLQFNWPRGTGANFYTIEGVGKTPPVISGGVKISRWKVDAKGWWHVTLPQIAYGKWTFSQLWVNGERRYRPHLPKSGYYQVNEQLSPSGKTGAGPDQFGFRKGDVHADWHDLNSVEVLPFHIWTMSRLRIASVDESKNQVHFTGGPPSNEPYFQMPRGNRYLVENVREALGSPGEWYLDRATGELTYCPKSGESPEKTEIIAPRLETLIEIKGEKDAPVTAMTFYNVAFQHTNYVLPEKGRSFAQAEVDLRGAVNIDYARLINFRKCRFQHLGAYGIDFGQSVRDCRFDDSELTDLGAGGVKIGTTSVADDPKQVTSSIFVTGCLIAHGGRIHPAGIGVWQGQAAKCFILDNEIADFYYTGVSLGWTWGYGPSNTGGTFVRENHIHDIGQNVLSDMGGIYTLGSQQGTALGNNVIHDIRSANYGGWGIYFDEGTTGILAKDNLVYNTKSAGFHQHYGKDNQVINNIFAFGEEAQLMRTRVEDHLSFTASQNIIVANDHPILGSNWSGDKYDLHDNLYWNVGKQPMLFDKRPFATWQAEGKDKGSIVADPRLKIKGEDYSLDKSVAQRIGFKPFHPTVLNGRPVPIWPSLFSSTLPGPLPPAPINNDFESADVGARPAGATLVEHEPAVIRVTDETAAHGTHSLKFQDRKGQDVSWTPHLYYEPQFTEGVATVKFSFRREAESIFYHAWRTNGSPYVEGPSLRVDADGWLSLSGEKWLQLPIGKWVGISIECGLGKASTSSYRVRVEHSGRTAADVSKPISIPKEFNRLNWLGFVADADADAVFYIDDLSATCK